VDGEGGEAVKDETVLIFCIAGSVMMFVVVFGMGLFLVTS
jgi:hypothetical protein